MGSTRRNGEQKNPSSEVDPAEVTSWVREEVASEIEELLAEGGEGLVPYAPNPETGAIDEWIAQRFIPSDPRDLKYPEGSKDGGIDIASAEATDDRSIHTIYQVSAPSLQHMSEGKLTSIGDKLITDCRRLHKALGVTGTVREQLNNVAKEVVGEINDAIERATEVNSTYSVVIRVQPISLRRVEAPKVRDYEQLVVSEGPRWSQERQNVTWELLAPLTPQELYKRYLGRRPSKGVPDRLDLCLVGDHLSIAHPQEGPILCFFKAWDLLKAYETYKAGLFESNLRFYLGSQSEVNKRILEALETAKGIKWFHVANNGVVFTCHSFRESRGKLQLVSPQVVNGGQTVVTIAQELARLEAIKLEGLDSKERERKAAIREQLVLSGKVIVTRDPGQTDQIAIASNTQNPLSQRTLRSTDPVMRRLKLALAATEPPWFLETKDGEWDAIRDQKGLMQARTRRVGRDFFVDGKRNNPRKVANIDLGTALLAFYGGVQDAKRSRVFQDPHFRRIFNNRIRDDSWSVLRERRSWSNISELLEPTCPGAHQCLLAWILQSFWKRQTLTNREQQILAFEERGKRDSDFLRHKRGGDWNVPDDVVKEVLEDVDSCYWTERIAKSSSPVLINESMKLLVRRYGELTDGVCRGILQLPHFRECMGGRVVSNLVDFRVVGLLEGPLTAIGLIMLRACRLLQVEYSSQIRGLLSPQQDLLQDRWRSRISDKVDLVVGHLGSYAESMGSPPTPVGRVQGLRSVLPDLTACEE